MTYYSTQDVQAAAHINSMLAAASRYRLLKLARTARTRRATSPDPHPDPREVTPAAATGTLVTRNDEAERRYAVSR